MEQLIEDVIAKIERASHISVYEGTAPGIVHPE